MKIVCVVPSIDPGIRSIILSHVPVVCLGNIPIEQRQLRQGAAPAAQSKAKAVWVFGAGPFQRGTIYEGTEFAGDRLKIPLVHFGRRTPIDTVSVAEEAYFVEPDEQLARKPDAENPKVAPKPKDAPERPNADDNTQPPGPA